MKYAFNNNTIEYTQAMNDTASHLIAAFDDQLGHFSKDFDHGQMTDVINIQSTMIYDDATDYTLDMYDTTLDELTQDAVEFVMLAIELAVDVKFNNVNKYKLDEYYKNLI